MKTQYKIIFTKRNKLLGAIYSPVKLNGTLEAGDYVIRVEKAIGRSKGQGVTTFGVQRVLRILSTYQNAEGEDIQAITVGNLLPDEIEEAKSLFPDFLIYDDVKTEE